MKLTYLLFLSFIYAGSLSAQNTAEGLFVNASGVQPSPSFFGPQDLHLFECGDDIIFDGSNSTGEDGYFIAIDEFDLASWTTSKVLFADWVCTPCTAPNNIDVLSFFKGQSPQCGQVYKIRLATRPVFIAVDRFFTIDCTSNDVPQVKTFDITRRIQEDTLTESVDFGLEGIINQDGEYVSIGTAYSASDSKLEMATTRYNLDGSVISAPQMGRLPDASSIEVIGAEEVISSTGNNGYLAILEEDQSGEVSIVRLDPTGAISWVDRISLAFNQAPVQALAKDFLIDGDRVVVTGELNLGGSTQPFILIYDYLARTIVCSQGFRLNPGAASANIGEAIANDVNNNHYTISGRSGNELMYLEVEYDCTFAPANLSIIFQVDGVPASYPKAEEIFFDSAPGKPIICGKLDGGPSDQLFVQNGTDAILLNPPSGKDVDLYGALLNQNNELVLVGQVHDATSKKGFMIAIDYTAVTPGSNPILWAKEYADGEYPESLIHDVDLADDGGYFTVGLGIQQNTATGLLADLSFFDTWVMKTDENGVLQNCNCHEETTWTSQSFQGNFNLDVVPFSLVETISNTLHNTLPLQYSTYYCDQYCPAEPANCVVEAIATKTENPEDLCCYDLSFFIDPIHTDEYTQIEIRPLPGAALTPLSSLNPQYAQISNTSGLISLVSNTGNLCNGLDRFFPNGNLPSVELCVTDFNGNMPMIEVGFITCEGEVCSDTLTLDCNPCIEIVNDSLSCDDGDLKYVFDFQNTWDQPIKRLIVNSYSPAGTIFTPDTLFFPTGIPVGGAAGANTIYVSNVSAPDSLKFDFKALGDDECCFCISNEICLPIPDCCDTCQGIEYQLTDTIINGEECCYSLDIYHCTHSLFTALRIHALDGITMSQQSARQGWSMYNLGQSSSIQQTWFPRPTPIHDTKIPSGWNRSKVNFCLDNYDGRPLPQTLRLEWLAGNDENILCTDSLTFECALPPPDSTCALISDTTWTCNPDGSYDLDLKVQVRWASPAYAIYLQNFYSVPAGVVVSTDPLVNTGVFATDSIVMMPTLNVSNLMPGDSLCFELALADTLDQYANNCCYVDICLVVPPCPPVCDTCNDIEYQLTDTIINGEECCYKLDFYQCTDSLLTALRLTALGGVTISQQSSGPVWSVYAPSLSSNTEQTWFPRPTPIHDTPIPTGWTRNEVSFCLSNYDGLPLPQTVKLEWLAGNDEEVICTDSLFFECLSPAPDSTCAQVVDTTWNCNPDGTYSLDMNIEVKWAQAAVQVYIKDFDAPAGVVVTPDPLVANGNFPANTLVAMPTLTVSNAMPGDTICFDLALADTIIRPFYSNECCHVKVCLVVPDCEDTGWIDCDELDLPDYNHNRLGWAAATCFSGFINNNFSNGINPRAYVVGLINVRGAGSATRGVNWPAPMMHYPAFTADTLGQVFGLAVDEVGCMYVSASSVYGNTVSGVLGFNWGVAGPGGVYKLCPNATTGAYHLTEQASLPNQGSSLGQVTYDPVHEQLFVSNFHDGKIYRLDATTLIELSTYDFPGYATATAAVGPDFVDLGERVWAVEYNPYDQKLYFSVWGEDWRNIGTVATNQVWSINIDGSGEFAASANYVLDLPNRNFGGAFSSSNTMPISDMAFSSAGRMLITERGMNQDHARQPDVQGPGHNARTFSYEWDGTMWTSARLQHIGVYSNPASRHEYANSTGGIDFGYADGLEGCDSMIWNMGDAVQMRPNHIAGMQGHNWPGNSNVPGDPDYVGPSSVSIDLDNSFRIRTKTQYGDVEIFRAPCCSETSFAEPDPCGQWEMNMQKETFTIQQIPNTDSILITPPQLLTAFDWWTLPEFCDDDDEDWIPAAGNEPQKFRTRRGNYNICIRTYRVLEGDTCLVRFYYEGSIEITPADNCIGEAEFQELVNGSLRVRQYGNQAVVSAPGLSENSYVIASFWEDTITVAATDTIRLSQEVLPYTYTFNGAGPPRTDAYVVEYVNDNTEEECNRSISLPSSNPAAIAIGLKLFPNPSQGNVNLDVELRRAGDLTISIFDLTGRKVMTRRHRATAGQQEISLKTSHLPPGTYLLRMAGEDFVAAAKFQRVR